MGFLENTQALVAVSRNYSVAAFGFINIIHRIIRSGTVYLYAFLTKGAN